MIPWLGPEDQHFVLPEGRRYETKGEQESYIREWLKGAGMTSEADDLGIAWYDARYHQVRYYQFAACVAALGVLSSFFFCLCRDAWYTYNTCRRTCLRT